MKRLFWRLAYPFALIANKLKWCGYKWVNLGYGAWHRERFNDLWHHRHFGSEIEWMPNRVILCGIGYRVSVAEGLVSFVEESFGSRILFNRDPHDPYGLLWYVELTKGTSACHVLEAYEWVKAVYGGSFDFKRPPISRTGKTITEV